MQLEILRRETDAHNLTKEDLEMELQALRHQMLSIHATDRDAGVTDSWDSDSRFNHYMECNVSITFHYLDSY